MEFEVIEEELGYRLVADGSTEDVSRDGARAVAVACMVDRSYQCLFEVFEVFKGTVERDGQCLLADPSLAEMASMFSTSVLSLSALAMASSVRFLMYVTSKGCLRKSLAMTINPSWMYFSRDCRVGALSVERR